MGRGRGLTADEKKRIAQLADEGRTPEVVAQLLGRPVKTIYTFASRNKVKFVSPRRAKQPKPKVVVVPAPPPAPAAEEIPDEPEPQLRMILANATRRALGATSMQDFRAAAAAAADTGRAIKGLPPVEAAEKSDTDLPPTAGAL